MELEDSNGYKWRDEKGQYKGTPPEHFQCQAKKRNGKRCKKWGLKSCNHRFCQFHGGRRAKKIPGIGHLPTLYKQFLNDSINDLVAQAMDCDPREQIALYDELALTRVAATDSIKLYVASKQVEGKDALRLQADAASIMAEALGQVRVMCQAAAAIENTGKDKFSIHSLKAIINQIVRVSHEVFKDYPELAIKFEQAIKEKVRMPSEVEGTTITPDMDVTEMDDTIPVC